MIGNSDFFLLESIWKNVYLQLLSYNRKTAFQRINDFNYCSKINSKPLKEGITAIAPWKNKYPEESLSYPIDLKLEIAVPDLLSLNTSRHFEQR